MAVYNEVMKKLEGFGTVQNIKIYKRHGASEPMFGVSIANLKKLVKEIKCDHDLAVQLWESGNMDAMTLATMIIDPTKVTSKQIDNWVKGISYYMLVDMFAGSIVSKSKYAVSKMEKWTKSKDEWIGRAGWIVLAHLTRSNVELKNEYYINFLDIIQRNIHSSKNRTRDAMNTALIAIGVRNPLLEKKAVAAAKVIGKVEVDHGETSCKTPDAIGYIKKTKAYRRGK